MGVVRVHEIGRALADDARQLPRSREVDLVAGRQRNQVRSLSRSAKQLAVRMRDENRSVAPRAQAEHGQEDLVLSAAPRPRGVDMEGEHSSHSFANLRPT